MVGRGESPLCLFALNNWKTIKAVNLAFSNFKSKLNKDSHAKFGILDVFHFPDVGKTHSDEDIFNLRISDRISRSSNDINMKLGLQSKLAEKNTITLKEINVNFISPKYDVIVIFWLTADLELSRSQILIHDPLFLIFH